MDTDTVHDEVVGQANTEIRQDEVFAEVPLFDSAMAGSNNSGDCGCFSCDGNPCLK